MTWGRDAGHTWAGREKLPWAVLVRALHQFLPSSSLEDRVSRDAL